MTAESEAPPGTGHPRDAAGRDDASSLIATASGGVTLAAGILGTLGVTGGVATSLLRNAPLAMLACVMLAGLGVLVGLLVTFVPPTRAHPKSMMVGASFVLLLIGLGWTATAADFVHYGGQQQDAWVWAATGGVLLVSFLLVIAIKKNKTAKVSVVLSFAGVYMFSVAVLAMVVLAAAAARAAGRPSIQAQVTRTTESGLSVAVHVTGGGLRAHERVRVEADLGEPGPKGTLRYLALVGPTTGGDIAYDFTIPAPDSGTLFVTAVLDDDHNASALRSSLCQTGNDRKASVSADPPHAACIRLVLTSP